MLLGDSVKKIFVTGGAGFIGSHVVDILISQGYEVTVYDDLSNGRREFIEQHFGKDNFEFYEANILDIDTLSDAMKGHDLVWHLAANTDIIGGYDNPTEDMQYIDYGMSILSKSIIKEYIPHNTVYDLADCYNQLSKKGQLAGFEVFERFYEIGSFSGLEEFKGFIEHR